MDERREKIAKRLAIKAAQRRAQQEPKGRPTPEQVKSFEELIPIKVKGTDTILKRMSCLAKFSCFILGQVALLLKYYSSSNRARRQFA